MVAEISVQELKAELESEKPPTLIDVREADELEISQFPQFTHIPLMELPARLDELDREADLVIVCHMGGRSQRAAAYMLQAGFRRVRNLAGGIDGWSAEIDPTMPRY